MTDVLFICDGASIPRGIARKRFDERIELDHTGRKPNFNLQIKNISGTILKELTPLSEDLVRVAGYVYIGDQLVSRGGNTDVYGHKWMRSLSFGVPVSDPDFWTQDGIQSQLCETLLFLTGDTYAFHFVKRSSVEGGQLIMDMPGLASPYEDADSVMSFSGGADSLGAVIDGVCNERKIPILVSHRPMPMLDNRQTQLAKELRGKFPQWTFPHVSVWAHLKGREPKDYTQRSRSFLYSVLASAVAYQTNINQVIIADNGVVSINIPKNAQIIGTYASRTTHPKFLYRVQDLFRNVYDRHIDVVNPLQFKTRAEVMKILRDHNCPELLQESVSCARTRQTAATPHCGVCSQCVDRRFGSLAANMEEYDLAERYTVDVFTEEIQEGEDRTQVESYVRFASNIRQLTDESIYRDYVELFDCHIPGDPDPDSTARAWIDLLRRHSEQVGSVMEGKIKQNATFLYEATLPDSCLIRLVATGSHRQDPKHQYAMRVLERLRKGIPKIFQSREPKNEHEVQDAVDGILSAAREELDRELPLLPFAGISTKPDFAKFDNLDDTLFYIEMKYLKDRARLNQVVTEISSRIPVYEKQGAFALFGVYDPHHVIPDDEKFERDLVGKNQAIVGIIR